MKNFLKIFIPIVVLVIIGATAYQIRSDLGVQFAPAIENLQNNISAILPKPDPCSEPIPYTLGTFDTQFGISQDYFLIAISEAEAIWDKPFGKKFFVYMPKDSSSGVLKINLVYDDRQQATDKLASLGIVVEDNKTSYDSLKAKYATLQAEYLKEKDTFNTQVSAFNQKQTAYETEVNYWNGKGGAGVQEYNQIQADHLSLQAESKKLQSTQTNLNGMVDEINALVVALNHLVSVLNLSVEQYNTTDTSAMESFEEGVYISDGISRQINIYEFSNRTKLVRAIAHELGHSLGLGHVTDPNAIMYKLNQGNSLALTQADISELETACGIKQLQ
jgi:hypothetical protein